MLIAPSKRHHTATWQSIHVECGISKWLRENAISFPLFPLSSCPLHCLAASNQNLHPSSNDKGKRNIEHIIHKKRSMLEPEIG